MPDSESHLESLGALPSSYLARRAVWSFASGFSLQSALSALVFGSIEVALSFVLTRTNVHNSDNTKVPIRPILIR